MYASGGGAGSCVARRTTSRLPSAPRGDRVGRRPVAGIEAALEAHLHEHARALDLLGHRRHRLDVQADGLLAEGRQPRARREAQERRVRRRRGRDHERVDACFDSACGRVDRAGPQFAGQRCARAGSASHEAERADALDPCERARVEGADAAHPHDADVEGSLQRGRGAGHE